MSSASAKVDWTPVAPLPTSGKKRALITAPASTDTSVIRQLLERQDFAPFTADELDMPGQSLSEILQTALGKAEIVVAILNGSAQSSNVFFELGFAQAMKKRVLLIVDAEEVMPMVVASGLPYFRAQPNNSEAIQYVLAQFLGASPHGRPSPKAPMARTKPLGSRVDELLARLRERNELASGRGLDQIVIEALRQSGVSTVSAVEAASRTDIAVWSDDLEPWVNNPFLIEVPFRLRTKAEAEEAIQSLAELMACRRVLWGLLIYQQAGFVIAKPSPSARVLTLPAEEFLESLRESSFGDIIRRLRNERVHGG